MNAKTFQETFAEVPYEDKARIALGIVHFLEGALSVMPTKQLRNQIEDLLFCGLRSAKQTHESGKLTNAKQADGHGKTG